MMPCGPPLSCPSAISPTATCRTRPSISSTRHPAGSGCATVPHRPTCEPPRRSWRGFSKEKEAAVTDQEYDRAQQLRDAETSARATIDQLRSEWHARQAEYTPVVGEEDIAQIVSMWTGVPVTRIAQEESERLLHMEDHLHERVIGQQDRAIVAHSAMPSRRARAGLKDPRRPIGSFIFLGPTGVGKTELAKTLSEYLFDDEDAMIRLDMFGISRSATR